jgi:hypothetical protein
VAEPNGNGTTGFIARELERLGKALREPQPPERYVQLYAAQQALCWAVDPECYAAPTVTVTEDRIVALTGTLAG